MLRPVAVKKRLWNLPIIIEGGIKLINAQDMMPLLKCLVSILKPSSHKGLSENQLM
jgi:hypothetical protein